MQGIEPHATVAAFAGTLHDRSRAGFAYALPAKVLAHPEPLHLANVAIEGPHRDAAGERCVDPRKEQRATWRSIDARQARKLTGELPILLFQVEPCGILGKERAHVRERGRIGFLNANRHGTPLRTRAERQNGTGIEDPDRRSALPRWPQDRDYERQPPTQPQAIARRAADRS